MWVCNKDSQTHRRTQTYAHSAQSNSPRRPDENEYHTEKSSNERASC